MSNSNALNQAVENWREERIELLPPNSAAQVLAAFVQMNARCSADIIELYSVTGGFDDCDSKCFTLWSLNRIIKESAVYKSCGVAFGDFLIESHAYYFKYENDFVSSVYTDFYQAIPTKIADSVNDFFELYLNNSEELGLF